MLDSMVVNRALFCGLGSDVPYPFDSKIVVVAALSQFSPRICCAKPSLISQRSVLSGCAEIGLSMCRRSTFLAVQEICSVLS